MITEIEKLPDIPSQLIRIAIKDLSTLERDPRYAIDMSSWHDLFNDVCYVCLAGAVMAVTLKTSVKESVLPYRFKTTDTGYAKPVDYYRLLQALNKFRKGDVLQGLDWMNLSIPQKLDREICKYEYDSKRFKREMLTLADDLEKVGL